MHQGSEELSITASGSEFKAHLETVSGRWSDALAAAGFDAAIVSAGEPRNYFLDDQAPALKLNPHFLQWCPAETASGSALLIRPGQKACLYFLQPDDYWHQPPVVPDWSEPLDVKVYAERQSLLDDIQRTALKAGNRVALVGEAGIDRLDALQSSDINPQPLLDHLHFARAEKTPFELACMRAATRKAIRGHRAASEAFAAGASEFQINLSYLAAAEHLSAELPYPNIVALNDHAGILHYQHYDRRPPSRHLSFLIDAGGTHNGYAADITRTYAAQPDSLYGELIARLDTEQQALIGSMTVGVNYLDLHIDMHRRLAKILCDAGVLNTRPETAFDTGLTEAFLPHGLGHLIGLQTHDVGGQQMSSKGGAMPPPENYPALRLTRQIGFGMPVTIEPGLYFIPSLLDALKSGPHAALVNWPVIEQLRPFGGIRIEDNVVLNEQGVENLTRDAFQSYGQT